MTNKAKLAFDLLEQEMEILSVSERNRIMGGTDPSNGDIWVVDGQTFVWDSATNTWVGCELNTVVITTTSTSSSGGYWSWSYYSPGAGSYWSFMLSSGGYVYGGGGSTGGGGSVSTVDFSGYTPYQIIDVLNSAGGITTNWTAAASDILKLETTMFTVASRGFGVLDIVLNANEMANQGFNWTDAGQIALAGVLLVPGLNVTVAVAGGIVLLSWEMYEVKNP